MGAGGAVPHFTDFDLHVRLGDVVVAAPSETIIGKKYIYQYCEKAQQSTDAGVHFETRSWCPPDLGLQQIAQNLSERFESDSSAAPWLNHFVAGLNDLSHEGKFDEGWTRPPPESDKLYMSVGGGDLIEVGHPAPRGGGIDPRALGNPVVHVGPVASGRKVSCDDQLRQEFAAKHGILAFDAELDAVMESIYGNRKDQYTLIRGMADYKDGSGNREWQQYAALMAASVLRSIVEEMPSPVY